MFSALHIFDFDGTLFRSPEPPPDWTGHRDWWSASESLCDPYVPIHPDPSWWIESTITEARKSIFQPDVIAILATGRGSNSFARYRVPELLKGINLDFDRVHLAPVNGMSRRFKGLVVRQYLERFEIQRVKAWEDTPENLVEMARVTATFGIPFEQEMIEVPPKQIVLSVHADRGETRVSG